MNFWGQTNCPHQILLTKLLFNKHTMPKLYRKQVYLSKPHIEYLKATGEGQFSRGIRELIFYHNTHEEMKVPMGRPPKNKTNQHKNIYTNI